MKIFKVATTGLARGFQDFAMKGNILELAVGFIIGSAFSKIVNSFVESIVMPIVSVFMPGGTWRQAKLVIGTIVDPQDPQKTVENAILIGQFLGGLLDFTIVALVIFLVIGASAKVKRKEGKIAAADTKECLYCLSTIPIEASKCAHCTSELPIAI